jgi:hypothetical protein
MNSTKTLFDEIDAQYQYLFSTRSVFPYMDESAIGNSKSRTGSLYTNKGFDVQFDFGRPLTKDDVGRIRAIGHWINQNYVIRLCALLEANRIIPTEREGKIDKNLEGSDEIDILRRLRNKFAHSSGRYDPNDPDNKKLYERIVDHFNVSSAQDSGTATDYPLNIKRVLLALTEGCKKYVVAFHEQSNA